MKDVDKEAEARAGLAKKLVGNEAAAKLLVATLEDITSYPQETTDYEARHLAKLAENTLKRLSGTEEGRTDLAKRLVGNEEAIKSLVERLEDLASYPQETTDFEARYLATLAENTLLQLMRDELARELKNEVGV
jgi:hypothetical protein